MGEVGRGKGRWRFVVGGERVVCDHRVSECRLARFFGKTKC